MRVGALLESVTMGDIVDYNCCLGTIIETLGDAAVFLLPEGVPDAQFNPPTRFRQI